MGKGYQRKPFGVTILILLLAVSIMISACPARSAATYDLDAATYAVADLEINDDQAGYKDYGYWIRWNVSSIPSGRTINSAILKLWHSFNYGDGDARIQLVINQTWTESDTASNVFNMESSNIVNITGLSGTGYKDYTVTTQFKANYGNDMFTIRIDDPDYMQVGTGTLGKYDGWQPTYGRNVDEGSDQRVIFRDREQGNTAPELEIILASVPAGTFQVSYDFPTAPDQLSYVTPQKYWNETQLLYNMPLYPYEASSNVTLAAIPTSYTFVYIHPNCSDYLDQISSSGSITFYDLYTGEYEAVFDPAQDWHTLHIMMHNPDLVGLGWESFTIYLNNTRVPYPPEYQLETGTYDYAVKDYFSQTILTGNHTIYASDPEDVYLDLEVPLYEVAFHNGDLAPYRVEITRNGITRERPAPPKGEAHAFLYGLAANVPYTVEVYNDDNDQLMDRYTLNVPNGPVAKPLEYDNDERVDFPSYKWIEQSFKTIQGQLVSTNQLVLLIGIGLFATILVQTRGILKNIVSKPLVKRRRNR